LSGLFAVYNRSEKLTRRVRLKEMSITEILESSVEERLKVIGQIWDSIVEETEDLPLTEAQRVDLKRRLEEHRRNPQDVIPWEEAKAQILGRI
jgi:putative addiction module component (TIGR02574 family)